MAAKHSGNGEGDAGRLRPLLLIRSETTADFADIFRVNASAFASEEEANLVAALREAGLITLSLVAEQDGIIAGNAVFSPMTMDEDSQDFRAVALGPLAVLPEYQRQGAGSALMYRGIELCREAGFDVMALLGSTEYYERFGFVVADRLNLICGDDGIPPDHFQALMLRGDAPEKPIRLRYAPQFFQPSD